MGSRDYCVYIYAYNELLDTKYNCVVPTNIDETVAKIVQNYRLMNGRMIVWIPLDTRLMCTGNPMLQVIVTAIANSLVYHGVPVMDMSYFYARLKAAQDSPNWHTQHTPDTERMWTEFCDENLMLFDCLLPAQYKQGLIQFNLAPPTPRLDPLQGPVAQALLMAVRQASLKNANMIDRRMLAAFGGRKILERNVTQEELAKLAEKYALVTEELQRGGPAGIRPPGPPPGPPPGDESESGSGGYTASANPGIAVEGGIRSRVR